MSQQRGAARMWWTHSREETQAALIELEIIGERLGGGFVVTPVRQRVVVDDVAQNDPSGKPLYETIAWCFKHESFMPAVDPSRAVAVVPPPPTELTEAELEQHFPDPVQEAEEGGEAVAAELSARGEPVYGDPTEGLTPTEIEANRAARAAGAGDPEAADAVVAAGDGGSQS